MKPRLKTFGFGKTTLLTMPVLGSPLLLCIGASWLIRLRVYTRYTLPICLLSRVWRIYFLADRGNGSFYPT